MAAATDLTGPISLQKIEKLDWYQETYRAAAWDRGKPEFTSLKNVMNQFEVRIYLGTWCGDTHEQVPAFVKLMQEAGVDARKFKYFALDRKRTYPGFKNTDKIEKLPTFIFFKENKEIGRITETPEVSLLEDTATIIKKAIR